MPEVTVCASSFQAASYIDRWVSHLTSFGPFAIRQIIVTDSLSSDGTPDLLRARGAEVLSERCTLGVGRNRAIAAARTPWVLVTDVDNEFDLARLSEWTPRSGRIGVAIDSDHRNSWLALGPRELFLKHPFVDQGGPGSGGGAEDLWFFARAPADLYVIRGLGEDLKRGRSGVRSSDVRRLVRFYNRWFQRGLSVRDVVRIAGKLGRTRAGWRYMFSDLLTLGFHVVTFGWSGRSTEFRE
ncbi:MAG: glycosyltransferase family 2 protein [Thermoplasmata archaeon]|nr:glycosyltransferase family 2 protein [Thermoplasmata archaeon]